MSKRKEWIPTRFTGLTYTGGIRPLPVPRRKREGSESKQREKAAPVLEHRDGQAQQVLTDAVDTSIIQNREVESQA